MTSQVQGPRHVAVIGAGIVGVCTALYLQRDGHRVTLIDRAGPGEGASKGNASVIAGESCVPVATPGILKRVPGMLMDPLGPLALRWGYLPRLAPWLWLVVALLAVGGSLSVETSIADRDETGRSRLCLAVAASGYGAQPAESSPALELTVRRCSAELVVDGAPGASMLRVYLPVASIAA